MKRLIIIVVLIIALFFGYGVVAKGLTVENLGIEISSYEDVADASDDLTLNVANYNKLNTTSYQTTLTSLTTAITEYNNTKEEYDELIEELAEQEEVVTEDEEEEEVIVVSSITVYEIDFLWARIGNYAKSEGLTLTMNVTKASSATSSSIAYGLYNLSFNVTGEYINIANFLYDIEDDDELGFEIRDYSMTSGQATFTVYNVPMNSDTLLDTATTTTTTDTTDTTSTDGEADTTTTTTDGTTADETAGGATTDNSTSTSTTDETSTANTTDTNTTN